ncbi:MAG TPA: hypothetical protein VM487_25725 [Phycisphaerae bacterium]|nr:hypothetical protein [Phycisphaerae bacterium]
MKLKLKLALLGISAGAAVLQLCSCSNDSFARFLGDFVGDAIFLRIVN